MLDRRIPYYNIIMKWDGTKQVNASLPEGYTIVPYAKGYENAWATLEFDAGDFPSKEAAKNYFTATYMQEKQKLISRACFLLNEKGEVCGSCIAWEDTQGSRLVSSLHWLIVRENDQGKGLGKALCSEILDIYRSKRSFPVYIHTQPWSWKAILLYASFGFKIQKTETFSNYTNQYEQAMATLKSILNEEKYANLINCSE